LKKERAAAFDVQHAIAALVTCQNPEKARRWGSLQIGITDNHLKMAASTGD